MLKLTMRCIMLNNKAGIGLLVHSEEDEGIKHRKLRCAVLRINKKNLLIVDDDPILRAILTSHLEHLPITITHAANGEVALGLLLANTYDACILDGMMPKLDGFSLVVADKEGSASFHSRYEGTYAFGEEEGR